MREDATIRELRLPAHFERDFAVHFYWVVGGLLLLRSRRVPGVRSRVDVLFKGVLWMGLPAYLDPLHVAFAPAEALPFLLPVQVRRELHRHRVYRLRTSEASYYVVASEILSAEDEGEYFDASALLPDFSPVATPEAPFATLNRADAV